MWLTVSGVANQVWRVVGCLYSLLGASSDGPYGGRTELYDSQTGVNHVDAMYEKQKAEKEARLYKPRIQDSSAASAGARRVRAKLWY